MYFLKGRCKCSFSVSAGCGACKACEELSSASDGSLRCILLNEIIFLNLTSLAYTFTASTFNMENGDIHLSLSSRFSH